MADPIVAGATGWLLTYLIHSTLLLGAVAGLTRFLRGRERVAEAVWRLGLFGGIITASLQRSGALAFLGSRGGGLGGADGGNMFSPPLLESGSAAFTWAGGSLITAGLVVWVCLALLKLSRVALGRLALARMLRGRIDVARHPLGGRVELGAAWRIRVTVSTRITTPMALGSGEVCLPERALRRLSNEELRAVLAHEMAHLERRDAIWLWVMTTIEQVLFLQPLNRLAVTRLRALAEFLCDDWAVRRTGSRLAMASALASAAEWVAPSPGVPAVAMVTRESLAVARVRRLLAYDRGFRAEGSAGLAMATMAMPLVLLALFGPGVVISSPSAPPTTRYTITAFDDAGPFTVTLERGRVLAMTMDGAEVPSGEIVQEGNRVRVASGGGRAPLELTLTSQGGMTWASRPADALW